MAERRLEGALVQPGRAKVVMPARGITAGAKVSPLSGELGSDWPEMSGVAAKGGGRAERRLLSLSYLL